MKTKSEIMEDLSYCSSCNEKYYSPFYFPMRNQEVMIITARPSMQAMYKPLYSIRFFRKLCLAMFGDKYIGENYLREFCGGNIYWTHYYKCLLPHYADYDNLKSNCAKRYLADEIKALHPKLIIVFGSETELAEKIEKIASDAGFNISSDNYISRQFPNTGAELCYNRVRSMIKPYISFMKDDNENDFLTGKYSYSVNNDSRGNAVHMNFELAALERIIGKNECIPNNIDDIWQEKVIIPNMERYNAVISTYSFIETQVKVLLSDYIIRNKSNTTIFEKLRENAVTKKPTCNECLNYISKYWCKALQDYVAYTDINLCNAADKLVSDINKLRKVRNCIIHRNGFIEAKDSNIQSKKCFSEQIKGIHVLMNTILVTKEAETTLLNLAKRTIDLLEIVER